MCGIVGLFLKDEALEPNSVRCWRECWRNSATAGRTAPASPSTGAEAAGCVKLTVRLPAAGADVNWRARCGRLSGRRHRRRDTRRPCRPHRPGRRRQQAVAAWLGREMPEATLVGEGRRMELYKDVGRPEVVDRAHRPPRHGRHARHRPYAHGDGIGGHHRRAPIPSRPAADQCLVHNGSLSNHNNVRRVAPARRHDIPDRERHRGRRRLSELAHAPGIESRRGARSLARRSRRLLHLRRRHRERLRRACAIRMPASPRSWPRRTAMSPSARNTARSPTFPASTARKVWEPEPRIVYFWDSAAVTHALDLVGRRTLRELNQALHELQPGINEADWRCPQSERPPRRRRRRRRAGHRRDRGPRRLLLRRHEQAGDRSSSTAMPGPVSPRT